MPPKQQKQQKPTAGGRRKQAQPVTWQSNAKMPELNLSSMVKLPKQAGVRVKISLKPNKKASYTAYQNIDTRLGEDRYIYSEAWSMGSTKTQYDNFSVPEERRHEQYTCKAEMWLETGGVPTKYKAGKLHEQPWGTAQGFKERRSAARRLMARRCWSDIPC